MSPYQVFKTDQQAMALVLQPTSVANVRESLQSLGLVLVALITPQPTGISQGNKQSKVAPEPCLSDTPSPTEETALTYPVRRHSLKGCAK